MEIAPGASNSPSSSDPEAPARAPGFRILVVAPESVGPLAAGPGLRALELARRLAEEFDTTLARPVGTPLPPPEAEPDSRPAPSGSGISANPGLRPIEWSRASIVHELPRYSLVLSQGTQIPARALAAPASRRPIHVFDLYNPILFEQLADPVASSPARAHERAMIRRLTRLLLERGDHFLCATPRQRDLWLGGLYALGRIDAPSPQAEDLVSVVPFGHAGGPVPTRRGSVLKGVVPGIGPDDEVLLWGGGVWNWFDPLVLLEAFALLAPKRPRLRLFFLGTRRPNPDHARNETLERAIARARELGVLGRGVVFNEAWTPYQEVADHLLEADLAVCTAPEGLENDFSFRTRLMDAVRVALPVVCTRGGFVADLVESLELGLTVPAGDPNALAEAIDRALEPRERDRFRANLLASRDALARDRVARPLLDFVRRAAHGRLQRRPERFGRPLLDYLRYKLPLLAERSLGARHRPDA